MKKCAGIRNIAVFCGSRDGDEQLRMAANELGRGIARSGCKLIYGGGDVGIMADVAVAADQEGGEVLGISTPIALEWESQARPIGELRIVDDMFERKKAMINLGDAFVALPGGVGTVDETTEVMTLRGLRYHEKKLILININGYWDRLLECFDELSRKNMAADLSALGVSVVTTVSEALLHLDLPEPVQA